MEIRRVAVVGGGLMGRQIALNAAIHGYETKVTDSIEAVRENISVWKDEYLAGRLAKGKMTEEQIAEIKARFAVAENIEAAVCDADLVIEAVIEKEDVKKSVFKEIGLYAPKQAIMATNSSRMPSSWFIDSVVDPSKLANMHYNNPALVMKAVEVQQNEQTSEDTVLTLVEFCKKNGKTVWDRMVEMYESYGYFKEDLYTITLKGIDGSKQIAEIMDKLRNNPPKAFGDLEVVSVRDYQCDKIVNLVTGEESTTGLPKSNVLYFDLTNDSWCCARPSGTEPKIKFYMGVKGNGLKDAEEKNAKLTEELKKVVLG